MEPGYQELIVNIGHEDELDLYVIRLEGAETATPASLLRGETQATQAPGKKLAGFQTIQQVDGFLKLNGGGFTCDPVETPKGYHRKARIATWAYRQLLASQARQLKKAA
jgi:hypothetical protein